MNIRAACLPISEISFEAPPPVDALQYCSWGTIIIDQQSISIRHIRVHSSQITGSQFTDRRSSGGRLALARAEKDTQRTNERAFGLILWIRRMSVVRVRHRTSIPPPADYNGRYRQLTVRTHTGIIDAMRSRSWPLID